MSAPAYLELHASGALRQRAAAARQGLAACRICPRRCGTNRLENETGTCRTGALARVASYHPHFGEEPPLSGYRGSGTIFFSSCNLLCTFCQNYALSHHAEGYEVDAEQLASIMLELQDAGCHNVNLVTPSHVVPQILEAVAVAAARGLRLPLVYNTSAYDLVETLRLLDGVVDLYLPDFKFWDPAWAERFGGASDYPEAARAAVREMYRQVGDLVIDADGLAVRGLLVRHLVMPEGVAGTESVMRFLAEQVSANTYVNVMGQYRPCGRALADRKIGRPIRKGEIEAACRAARAAGLHRLADG